jgi:phosphate transport system substrate-binding protein
MGGPRWGLAAALGLGVLSLAACGGRQGSVSAAPAVITDIGSDTMVNLALAWAEAYAKVRPEVRISVTGGGTGTGIGSLLNGTADMANASRAMKPEEFDTARAQGLDAVQHVVARDAIAVIVHPDNPVRALSIAQLAAVFSGKIRNWKEVGGHDGPIVRASREVNSGTHVYFLEAVVRQGQKKDKTLFAPDTLLLPSSEGIMAEVSQNPNAIGYDGLGYVTEAVGVVAVAAAEGQPPVAPSARTVQDRSYPVARDLYIYTRRDPQPAVRAYLAWIAEPAAQLIVRGLGFVPVE